MIVQKGLSVRAAEQAARWAGARQRPRKRQPVSPALAERVRVAVRAITGSSAKVTVGRIEIPFGDETELAEVAEALERAAASA
jgi:hypothetical protein